MCCDTGLRLRLCILLRLCRSEKKKKRDFFLNGTFNSELLMFLMFGLVLWLFTISLQHICFIRVILSTLTNLTVSNILN